MNAEDICPLCGSHGTAPFHADCKRCYRRCYTCSMIFVPRSFLPSKEEEKNEYDKHRNSPRDEGYRRFLKRLLIPVHSRLAPASKGLDFGSGPGPTLSVMFEELGHIMNIYDPLYATDKKALKERYDFISASEVMEHCHNPVAELDLLWSILRPGGILAIMTGFSRDRAAFSKWRYKDDSTHVCFFSENTMHWIGHYLSSELYIPERGVCLFTKNSNPG